jgi:hypothetical protein
MARTLIGKEPIDSAKESGKLAKAINAPARAHKACMLSISKRADKMIAAVESLEKSTEAKRENRAADDRGVRSMQKKPSLMERLEAKKKEIKERELEKPPIERAPKPRGLEV